MKLIYKVLLILSVIAIFDFRKHKGQKKTRDPPCCCFGHNLLNKPTSINSRWECTQYKGEARSEGFRVNNIHGSIQTEKNGRCNLLINTIRDGNTFRFCININEN